MHVDEPPHVGNRAHGEKVKEGKAGERSGERFVNVPPWEIEVLLYAFSVSDEAPDAA